MDSPKPWRVQTFGGFAVERGGVRRDRFRTQHAAALLSYLALKPDVRHSREVLADLLWPETDPLVARQRLSTTLANLRKEMETAGPPVFAGGRDSVGIQAGMLTSDAAEFMRLVRLARNASRERRRALLLDAVEIAGKGPFLPGFYFDWALEQASHFEETLDALRSELESETNVVGLPAEDPSSLVGRVAEIESLDRLLLERPRCISILGAGGVGKTRLALDLFERHARRFSGAKVFVRLAEVRNASDFLPAVARALNLPFDEAKPLLSAIAEALAVPGLVVLDNLEHLLPEIHMTLDGLFRSCGHSTFICTSRRRLGVTGEHVLRVRPLRVAPITANQEDLADSPAVKLFLARYRESGGTPLPPERLPAVAKICRSLGGLPLAIQLAASASVAVGVDAMGEDATLYRLLPGRSPDATNAHASLADLIQWSLALLDEPTLKKMEALCLLPGSFDLRMIRRLHGEEVTGSLPRLHSDSLLEADGNGVMRVLEPIREHVLARIDDARRTQLEVRLIERCVDLAEGLETRLEGRDQRAAMEEATLFWPTLRLAAQLAGERRMPNEGLTILAGLHRFFLVNGTGGDAVALCQPLLTGPGIHSNVQTRTHASLARHAYIAGRYEISHEHCLAGIALAEEIGDTRSLARCTYGLAFWAISVEDQDQTLSLGRRALELGRQVGDIESQVLAQLTLGLAYALYKRDATPEESKRSLSATEAHMAAAVATAQEAKDEFMEALALYFWSGYGEPDIDLYHARLGRAIEIHRRNGWKLREAQARMPLVRRLYAAGQMSNVLEELHSLQTVYAECGRWEVRAEQVAIEAEILFRMNRYDEALAKIEEAMAVLRLAERIVVVEAHVQSLIYGALMKPEMAIPLRFLVEREDHDEFSAMMAELAKALLEVRSGKDVSAYERLQKFKPESKPTRVQHAYADTLVALADMVATRNRSLAIAAYRRSRPIYRAIKSNIDLQRVRVRVSRLGEKRSEFLGAQPLNPYTGTVQG